VDSFDNKQTALAEFNKKISHPFCFSTNLAKAERILLFQRISAKAAYFL
jgi:hypothetical protein